MARMGRPGLSVGQKAELWTHWQLGQSLSEIGRALGKHAGSIHGVVSSNGGIVPSQRRRSRLGLTLAERESISRGLASRLSMRQIAKDLRRAPSTICREVSRNHGSLTYRAVDAETKAWARGRRPKACLLAIQPELCTVVAVKLRLDWSPEQISGWLKREYPDDPSMHVSHETIYRSLFIQARGVLKKELMSHLRSRRIMRRSRLANTEGQPRGQIVDAISIRQRPPEIEDRAIPGHWEGDLISGSKNSHIATLVERHSRFTMLVKVEGKDTLNVVSALSRQVQKLPIELRRSLTWDHGSEMAQDKKFTVATAFRSTSVIPEVPGKEARTKIPTVSCDSISRRELICLVLPKAIWIK